MSLNTFADHAPKPEWVRGIIENAEQIESVDSFLLDELNLGPVQKTKFKRFLTDSGLIAKNKQTALAEKLAAIGWDSAFSWSVILANLVANNPQMRWYTDNLVIGNIYTDKDVEEMLQAVEVAAKDASSIRKSFKRLVELPLGTRLNWGFYYEEGRGNATMGRRPCRLSPDDRLAVLYALYLYSEKCENLDQFTLTHLLDDAIVSGGTSPAKLFGLGREELAQFLSGLAEAYPDFLGVTFTHDLEKISLREGKTSADVLELIER